MNWTTLVEAADLGRALDDPSLRIVDARFALMEPSAGRAGYLEAHLPGAMYADLNEDLSNLSTTGEGRHPLPSEADFAATLGRWGIDPETQVVVYDAGDGSMAAARLWWLLKLCRHSRVAVLDGGLAAWRALGLPETVEGVIPAPLAAYPTGFDRSAIVEVDEVQSRLGQAEGWLLDARAPERFRGEIEPIDSRAGHIPGAVNRPYLHNLRDGCFKPAAELRAELEPMLLDTAPGDVVLMCGSGVTACHLLLAFAHAGLSGARIYAGSWSGWISDPSRPIDL